MLWQLMGHAKIVNCNTTCFTSNSNYTQYVELACTCTCVSHVYTATKHDNKFLVLFTTI